MNIGINNLNEYIIHHLESSMLNYKIDSKKSKYEGWIEYTIYATNGNKAGSCIINNKTGDCANVMVMDNYRHKGYMKYLLKYLIAFEGVKYVQVSQDNHAAISLYKKIGFEIEFKYIVKNCTMYSMVFKGNS